MRLVLEAFLSFPLSLKNDSLRVIDRLRSDIDVLRDKDLAGIGGAGCATLAAGVGSTGLSGGFKPIPLVDVLSSALLGDRTASAPSGTGVKPTSFGDGTGSTSLADGVESIPLVAGAGSAPLVGCTGSIPLNDGVESGLFTEIDRSELVTRITGSILFAAIACSIYGEEGSLRLELLPDVLTLKLGGFWIERGGTVGLGASGRGLCGDRGGV